MSGKWGVHRMNPVSTDRGNGLCALLLRPDYVVNPRAMTSR
jgi:hypothetical protein